jgi:hypothetical protein
MAIPEAPSKGCILYPILFGYIKTTVVRGGSEITLKSEPDEDAGEGDHSSESAWSIS